MFTPTSTSISATLFSALYLISSIKCHQAQAQNQDHNFDSKAFQERGDEIQLYRQHKPNKLLIVTAATNRWQEDEAFTRFNKSIETFDLKLVVLGAQEKWIKQEQQQGQVQENEAADLWMTKDKGFRKIDLLKSALRTYKDERDLLIMWLDNPNDSIVNAGERQILNRFANSFHSDTRILFSASASRASCLLSNKNETVTNLAMCLNSAAFIGYANSLWSLLEDYNCSSKVAKTSSQLYYRNAYLNNSKQLGIRLDHKAELFQTLHSSSLFENDLELAFESCEKPNNNNKTLISYHASCNKKGKSRNYKEHQMNGARLKNKIHKSEPLVVVSGNKARSKILLNSLGNYLARAWTPDCRDCGNNSTRISLSSIPKEQYPSVLIALFIHEPTPFLEDFFETVLLLNYPRNKLHLFVHNSVDYHKRLVGDYFGSQNKYKDYFSSQEIVNVEAQANVNCATNNINKTNYEAREYAMRKCLQLSCDYYLSLDSVARLDDEDSLRVLIEENKTIVAPLLVRAGKLWSNFWGSLNQFGYYERSFDYVDLVKRQRLGTWNVAHIMNAYLIKGSYLREQHGFGSFYYDPKYPTMNSDYVFSHKIRQSGTKDGLVQKFMFMTNEHDFGHLVDPTEYNITLKYPEFYQLKQNMLDWEQTYLHDNYSLVLNDDFKLEQPCQDVFWFPIVNDLFCQQLIDIMEQFNQWSGGTNHDPRIEGGYESVPTRDIHLKQVGLHDMWLLFLREYVMPIQLKEYIGYEHDPPQAELAFVVRYHPSEQASLRPHHDSSTYTMNIALNSPGKDYTGGGCNFVRYNCSVVDSRRGWALLHPGRLTHYHEGLTVTNGTRYILVTFIDP